MMYAFVMKLLAIDGQRILEQLSRMLSSDTFRRAERSRALLRFVVEETVQGRSDRLKEYTLGVEALGRGDSFDPRADPIVRAEASRLRTRLERYYEIEGTTDPILVQLPKGSYVPQFLERAPQPESDDRTPPECSFLRNRWWQAVGALSLVLIAAVVVALLRSHSGAKSSNESLLQFDVELKSSGTLGSEVGQDIVLSPDGARLVFISRETNGLAHLNSRRLDQAVTQRMPETDGARSPFFSPDGRWVGFWSAGKIKKAPVDGGSPVVLCDATDLLGASWEEENSIVAALNPTKKLFRIPAAGGEPKAILDLSEESAFPAWPQVVPASKYMIYTSIGGLGADRANIEVRGLEGGDRKILVHGGTFGRYVQGGFLTYVNQGTLYAQRFDIDKLELVGNPVPVLEDISYSRAFGYAQIDFSRAGTLVYRKGAESELFLIEWLDRQGNAAPLLARPGRYVWLRISPEGGRLAYSATEAGGTRVWCYDIEKDETRPITAPSDAYGAPVWWPDGKKLILGGGIGLAWIESDRPDKPHALTSSSNVQIPWAVSTDHRRLTYYENNPATGFDLWSVEVKETSEGMALGQPEAC